MGESPGSVRNQIGRTLLRIDENIEQEDVLGIENHIRALKAKLSVYFKSGTHHCVACGSKKAGGEREAFEAIKARDGADPAIRFEQAMLRLEFLLRIATRQKIYARPMRAVGDANHLAIGREDEDDVEEDEEA